MIHDVNSFHSDAEWYHRRWIAPQLRAACQDHPAVVVTGARQVGKSTLLQYEEPFRDWHYRTMDDYDALQWARESPEGLWAGSDAIVLDEVQKAPEILSAVKQAIDSGPQRRFVLCGSANLLLMRQVSESLAGRAVWFALEPMTLGEMRDRDAPKLLADALAGRLPSEGHVDDAPDPVPLLLRGFMPALLPLESPTAWLRWWEGYVATYLERDLRQFSRIEALPDYRRVMQLLALRSAQLLNQSEVARDAGVSQPTVHRYVNLLETTHLLHRLPSYAASRTTSVLKRPRVFWTDPGLAIFLSGYYDDESLRASRELGFFFKTMVFLHFRALARLLAPRARLYFWQSRTGHEVDFVVEHGRRLLAVEVKLTDRPGYRHTEGLRRFMAECPQVVGGLLVCGGNRVRRLDERIAAVPWAVLAGQA